MELKEKGMELKDKVLSLGQLGRSDSNDVPVTPQENVRVFTQSDLVNLTPHQVRFIFIFQHASTN